MKVFQARPPVLVEVRTTFDTLSYVMPRYIVARIDYADALQLHRQACKSFDADRMHEATDIVSAARKQYMEMVTILREAHKNYKAAFRNLLVGKYL